MPPDRMIRRGDLLSRLPKLPAILPLGFKAGDGTRTRGPLLGKEMLYQLSYSRKG